MEYSKVIHKYKSTSRLAKVFIWLSVILVLAFVTTYGSSITWTMIGVVILGWPLILAWFVVGAVLLLRPDQPGKTDEFPNEHLNENGTHATTKNT